MTGCGCAAESPFKTQIPDFQSFLRQHLTVTSTNYPTPLIISLDVDAFTKLSPFVWIYKI